MDSYVALYRGRALVIRSPVPPMPIEGALRPTTGYQATAPHAGSLMF